MHFITASDAAEIYRDQASHHQFGPADIRKIGRSVGNEVGYQKHGDFALTPAEVMYLLVQSVVDRTSGKGTPVLALHDSPLGPTGTAPAMPEEVTTDLNQFTRTSSDVLAFMNRLHRVPSSVWLGSTAVTPEAYLVALARLLTDMDKRTPIGDTVVLKRSEERRVGKECRL